MRKVRQGVLSGLLGLVLTAFACEESGGGGASDGGGGGGSDGGGGVSLEELQYARANLARGGQLYDAWWEVRNAKSTTVPDGDNPQYALTEGTASGPATFRCKECHGWDYKGKDGAYGSGSHYTGVPGILAAADKDPAEIMAFLRDGVEGSDGLHAFGAYLSDEDLWDLTRFVKEGTFDLDAHIDRTTKSPKQAHPTKGQVWYESTCAFCHGTDGRLVNFGDAAEPEYLGTVAAGNPWEFQHKVRFGQPGTDMPSGIASLRELQEVMDLLGFARSLPAD